MKYKKISFKSFVQLIPSSIKDLNKKNPLQLASSTAFFGILSIPPILVILVSTLGIFIKPSYLNNQIFNRLTVMMGDTGTSELKNVFLSFNELADDTWASIGVFAFLLFIGTNLFFLIEMNINQLWDVPSKSNTNFVQHLKGRLTSIVLLLIGASIIILALVLETVVSFIGDQIIFVLPALEEYVVPVLSQLFSFITFFLWFMSLYKFLPNASLKWNPAIVGGLFMAFLFKLGQLVISNILINGSIKSVFSASGSIVLVMLFIFYTSFIFYFVAMFLKKYCELRGMEIEAKVE